MGGLVVGGRPPLPKAEELIAMQYWLAVVGLANTVIIQCETVNMLAVCFDEYKYLFDVKWVKWYYTTTSLTRVPISVRGSRYRRV